MAGLQLTLTVVGRDQLCPTAVDSQWYSVNDMAGEGPYDYTARPTLTVSAHSLLTTHSGGCSSRGQCFTAIFYIPVGIHSAVTPLVTYGDLLIFWTMLSHTQSGWKSVDGILYLWLKPEY